jgi:hypothetical protein
MLVYVGFSAGTLCKDFLFNKGFKCFEEADDLAGVGSKTSFCGPEPCLPVPKSLMTRVTKELLSGNHLSYWN